jgi:hypothetical protein
MIRTFFVAACFLLLGLVACSKQSLGQACSRNFNDDDCESGLVCKAPTQGRPEGYCCPANTTIGAPTQCQDAVQIVTDAGTDATTSDGGSDAATDADAKADSGTDASDASDASDAGDADTGL